MNIKRSLFKTDEQSENENYPVVYFAIVDTMLFLTSIVMIAIGASRSKDLLIVGFALLGVAFLITVCYFGISKYLSLEKERERSQQEQRERAERMDREERQEKERQERTDHEEKYQEGEQNEPIVLVIQIDETRRALVIFYPI